MTQTTTSTPTEGAIQFRLCSARPDAADALDAERFKRLAAWRQILKHLKLIGRAARRYDGFAFGNLSVRDNTNSARFFVTASQTGGDAAPVAPRTSCASIAGTRAVSRSPQPAWRRRRRRASRTAWCMRPTRRLRWIMHVHSPAIWRTAARLGLPVTPAGRAVWIAGDGECGRAN